MSLSAPHRTTGEMITASIWNTDLVDAINSLLASADGTTWQGPVQATATFTAATGGSVNGNTLSATINKAGSGSHPGFIGTLVNAPVIGGGSASVVTASTLVVNGAPTGATTNYALLVIGNGLSQIQGTLQFYTGTNHGITFDDSRETGPLTTTVAAYLGPLNNELLVMATTDVPLVLGQNNVAVLTLGNGTSLPSAILDQGAADLEALIIRSTDVVHGFTSDTDASSYGTFRKSSPTNGGLAIAGYTETTTAMNLNAQYTTGDTAKTTSAGGALIITANKLSGSTAGAMGANDNAVVIRNNTGTRIIFTAEGQMYFHGAAAASFDEWDDIALARSLDLTLKKPGLIETAWDAFVSYRRDDLERAGILDGEFVNANKHLQLLNGVSWQLWTTIQALSARITGLEARA